MRLQGLIFLVFRASWPQKRCKWCRASSKQALRHPRVWRQEAQSCQGVRIGAVGLMLSYEDSSELTEVPELYYLPNSPVWVKGLANLHGNLIPVLDVAEYLGIEAQNRSFCCAYARPCKKTC